MTTSDKFQRHSFKVAFKLTAKKSYFDIWHFWKSYCWLRLIWGLDHRSRSRSRRSRYILPGAGAVEQFYSEPEPEPECFPGAGAGADQKCHGSASLPKSTIYTNFHQNRKWSGKKSENLVWYVVECPSCHGCFFRQRQLEMRRIEMLLFDIVVVWEWPVAGILHYKTPYLNLAYFHYRRGRGHAIWWNDIHYVPRASTKLYPKTLFWVT